MKRATGMETCSNLQNFAILTLQFDDVTVKTIYKINMHESKVSNLHSPPYQALVPCSITFDPPSNANGRTTV